MFLYDKRKKQNRLEIKRVYYYFVKVFRLGPDKETCFSFASCWVF